jgi:hypothetical protein
VDVPTRGPLIFTDPKSMMDECVAGTGIAQIIGWGVRESLENRILIDLFPTGTANDFRSSRSIRRASILQRRCVPLLISA